MILQSTTLYIRTLEAANAEALHQLEVRNRAFWQNFTMSRVEEFYTLDGQRERINRFTEQAAQDQGYLFGIFLPNTFELIGTVTLTEVLRGSLQGCFIGYMLDQQHNGKGYMTEAVKLVVTYAFEELRLHRIEAGVMPHNIGSIKVLEKAGFHKEGIAQKNVKINGRWEDHQVLAIINDDPTI